MERVELEIAVDAGLSIGQLAERFGCSKGSVRYWLGKYGLKTQNRSGRNSSPTVEAARAAGLSTFTAVCPTHGKTEFVVRSDGGTRCKRCRSQAVVNRRRRVKEILVAEAGGRCALCGYCRYVGALALHHVDPTTKLLGLANKGRALSIKTLRGEAQKCVLLCHNCHAEVEAGLLVVPIHLRE
ncbi:MAG TPA: hypothetical protein VHU61_04545 [Solirubrobacteraceae bacterium]|nr:hypothetical protein [Solirubrobacteraceae bacterium]